MFDSKIHVMKLIFPSLAFLLTLCWHTAKAEGSFKFYKTQKDFENGVYQEIADFRTFSFNASQITFKFKSGNKEKLKIDFSNIWGFIPSYDDCLRRVLHINDKKTKVLRLIMVGDYCLWTPFSNMVSIYDNRLSVSSNDSSPPDFHISSGMLGQLFECKSKVFKEQYGIKFDGKKQVLNQLGDMNKGKYSYCVTERSK